MTPSEVPSQGRPVVIGVGNRFLHDDAAGIRVAEAVKRMVDGVRVEEYEEMDLSLLQEMKGASSIIIVDSVKSGAEPGAVTLFRIATGPGELEDMPSLHELDLSDLVRLAERIGLIDCEVTLVGIEPADLSVGEGLSAEVEAAIPRAASAVVSSLDGGGSRDRG